MADEINYVSKEMSTFTDTIENMFSHEMRSHGRAYLYYQQLTSVSKKDMTYEGFPAVLLFNPGRVRSVMADVSKEAIAKRPCFLCPNGLEEHQLTTIWQNYNIRVNPFPIFERHYTISFHKHQRQEFLPHLHDMLLLAQQWEDMTLFYNGPFCGASAPDHMHFQAIPQGVLPIETHYDQRYVPAYRCDNTDIVLQEYSIHDVLSKGTIRENEWEPRWNILTWYDDRGFHTIIFFRKESQPKCFFDNKEPIHISPATVEMAGIGVVVDDDSFSRLTPQRLHDILIEVVDK